MHTEKKSATKLKAVNSALPPPFKVLITPPVWQWSPVPREEKRIEGWMMEHSWRGGECVLHLQRPGTFLYDYHPTISCGVIPKARSCSTVGTARGAAAAMPAPDRACRRAPPRALPP